MEATCKWCHQRKSLSDFVKGNDTLCKICAAAKQRQKINCLICNKEISYGNMSKHMFSHNHNNPFREDIICECGKKVCKYSIAKHLLSKKHIQLI